MFRIRDANLEIPKSQDKILMEVLKELLKATVNPLSICNLIKFFRVVFVLGGGCMKQGVAGE